MLVLFGCVTINAQGLKKAAVLIGCKPVNEQNFDLNTTDSAEFDKWKKDEFKAQKQISFAAKCRVKDGLRYTFWFEEETYASKTDATARLSKNNALPPKLKKEFKEYDGKTLSEYMFREAFQRGNKVYIVSAKAFKLALEDEISRISEKLKSKIK